MRIWRSYLLVVIVLVPARPARASLFGEENVQLATLVGLETKEIAEIGTMLSNLKLMLQGINETAAGVRQAYKVYNILRNYSIDDLLRDAKTGLYKAFPELEGIEEEMEMLVKNGEAVHTGQFFTHVDAHDTKARALIDAAFRHAYQSTIYPLVFPDGMKLQGAPSEADRLVHKRLQRSGMQLRSILENTALGILAKKTGVLVKEAEKKGRIDLQAVALTAQASTQIANNTAALRRLEELSAAQEEAADKNLQELDEKVKKSLRAHTDLLLGPRRME